MGHKTTDRSVIPITDRCCVHRRCMELFLSALVLRHKTTEQSQNGASATQRTMRQMKNARRCNSGRGNRSALFRLAARLVHDRRALCWLRAEAFGASRSLSSWLARTNRCVRLSHKGGHDPTNLPECDRTACGSPSARAPADPAGELETTGETPGLRSHSTVHRAPKPEHVVFQQAEERVLRETQTVALWHLLHGHQRLQGEKPTHARITRGYRVPRSARLGSPRGSDRDPAEHEPPGSGSPASHCPRDRWSPTSHTTLPSPLWRWLHPSQLRLSYRRRQRGIRWIRVSGRVPCASGPS